MFFSKSRREREQESQQNFLRGISSLVEEAKKSDDVGEKYLKLSEARNLIEQTEENLRLQIRKTAAKKGDNLFLGTVGAGTAVGVLAFAGIHFPPLFILAGPALGWYYGGRAGHDLAVTSEEKALSENKEFFDKLDSQLSSLKGMTADIERTQLRTLAASPRYEEILKKSPQLRDQFAAAFGRQIAAEEQPPAPPPPKNNPDGFKL
jgi:hypothetical protein